MSSRSVRAAVGQWVMHWPHRAHFAASMDRPSFTPTERCPAEPEKSPFSDVSADSPYADAIRWAAERGIAAGKTASTFDPSGTCTRGQAVTFLWRAAGKPTADSGAAFSGVAADAYCAQAVRWAAEQGVVTGYADGSFHPNATVTREQMAAILFRFAKARGMDTTQGGMAVREFEDFGQVSVYAGEAMAWAVNAGILQSRNNRLLPQAPCTRGQTVTLLCRLLKG